MFGFATAVESEDGKSPGVYVPPPSRALLAEEISDVVRDLVHDGPVHLNGLVVYGPVQDLDPGPTSQVDFVEGGPGAQQGVVADTGDVRGAEGIRAAVEGPVGRLTGRRIVSPVGSWETAALASTVFHIVKLTGGPARCTGQVLHRASLLGGTHWGDASEKLGGG